MFEKKSHKNNKLWIAVLVLVVLAAVIIVLEAQILVTLKDLQTSVLRNPIMDSNPMPPIKAWYKDLNPLLIK